MAAELNTAHDLTTLKSGLLAAELHIVYDLIFLWASLVTAELNTRKTRIGKGGLLAAELNTAHDNFERQSFGSGAKHSS